MKQNGVMPGVSIFTLLIQNLLHDGDIVAAQHIYYVEMPEAGIAPDDITKKTIARADELAGMGRMSKLKNMLKQHGNDAARQEFEEMQKSGHADAIHYSWAMKELCETSDEVRALMESMKQNGVMPNVTTFTLLMNNLLHDGDIVAAQHVFDVEMPAAGIEPDNITKQTMARADELASQGRTVKLKKMLKQQGKDAARQAFEEMQTSGHANLFQYGWALTNLCKSSNEIRALMESMKKNGVLPDVTTFNQLIQSLLHDGDIDTAQHVYDVDMPTAGIEPNDRTKKTIARANELASQGRTIKLKKIIDRQGEDAARQEFEEMQKSGHADLFQYGWAMKYLCETSDKSRALMESMKQNGVLPDVGHFTQLISNLLHDGDIDTAQHVYDVEMPAAGIEPNDRTINTMARAETLAK
jgi:pentatricopeptide repeat protein